LSRNLKYIITPFVTSAYQHFSFYKRTAVCIHNSSLQR